ncbi:hypothetical protein GCM10022600_07590 [Qipengyuania pelagi]|jgi:hypothetical protein|uniref:Uncharacterized protein n=1 Tax=Qipengyuania pelagi TaxID=994320 RepID=A0A844YAU9_9SPHN|nr:hypothetical protein [Qipengyuania pelagi]MXO54363.1 hypothetical protein [Qipengyuania pelagi]
MIGDGETVGDLEAIDRDQGQYTEEFHVVMVGRTAALPRRVVTVVDFFSARARVD